MKLTKSKLKHIIKEVLEEATMLRPIGGRHRPSIMPTLFAEPKQPSSRTPAAQKDPNIVYTIELLKTMYECLESDDCRNQKKQYREFRKLIKEINRMLFHIFKPKHQRRERGGEEEPAVGRMPTTQPEGPGAETFPGLGLPSAAEEEI